MSLADGQLLRQIGDAITSAVWASDIEGRAVFVNQWAADLLGYSISEMMGRSFFEFLLRDDWPSILAALERRREGFAGPIEHTARLVHKDGGLVPVSFTTYPLYEDGVYAGAISVDMTAFRQVELELAKSEGRFRRFAENAVDLVYRIQLVPRFAWEYVNPALERITGYSPEEYYADPELGFRAMHPDDREFAQQLIMSGANAVIPATYRLFRKDGELIWLEVSYHVILDDAGSPVAVEGIARDVTEHRLADERLRLSEERFRAVFNSSRAGMLISDDERQFLDANPAACRLLGLELQDVLATGLNDIIAESSEEVDRGYAEFVRDGYRESTTLIRRSDGSIRDIEYVATANVQPGRNLWIFYDVTERRQLEEQLRQAQKMEAIGQLAGGVAHDFNNELAAIRLYAEVALRHLEDDHDQVRRELEGILWMTESGRALTGQLLTFGRKQALEPMVLDANDVVRRSNRLLRRLIGENIELDVRLQDEPLFVETDPFQLEQALLNLALNARDAMPHGGTLRVATQLGVATSGDLPDGDYAAISVGDTGAGFAEEALEHLFEPFFTTKRHGEGTGLGLATVYGFMRQCGGTVHVVSEPGSGATVTLLLPLAVSSALPEMRRAEAELEPGNGETVLVVEDEQPLRELVAAILEEHRYTILSAESGEEALRVAESHDGPIHVLLSDLLMPRMTGRELATRLVETHPEARAVFMSGYPADTLAQEGVTESFVRKPFGAGDLVAAIRRTLAA